MSDPQLWCWSVNESQNGGYINNTGLKQEYSRRTPVVMMDHDKPLDFAIACLSANPCYMTSRFPLQNSPAAEAHSASQAGAGTLQFGTYFNIMENENPSKSNAQPEHPLRHPHLGNQTFQELLGLLPLSSCRCAESVPCSGFQCPGCAGGPWSEGSPGLPLETLSGMVSARHHKYSQQKIIRDGHWS